MRKLILALAATLALGGSASAQTKKDARVDRDVWCEENCKQMCRRTRGATAAEVWCYQTINCAQFRGRQCAPQSEVDRRVAGYCNRRASSHVQTFADKRSMAKAAEAIQLILRGKQPELWYGATVSFMQKIVDFATDQRSTLKDKYDVLLDYAMAHKDIVAQNVERKAVEQSRMMAQQEMNAPPTDKPKPATGIPPGVQGAMNVANLAA